MSNRRRIPKRVRPIEQLSGFKPEIERYNAYQCDTCNKTWITVDLNMGVTPLLTQCFATEGCKGRGRSQLYPSNGIKPPARLGPVIIEWFRPDKLDSYSVEMQIYLRKGGLARRAAPSAPSWVKKIA